jgi:hypothetical protein
MREHLRLACFIDVSCSTSARRQGPVRSSLLFRDLVSDLYGQMTYFEITIPLNMQAVNLESSRKTSLWNGHDCWCCSRL